MYPKLISFTLALALASPYAIGQEALGGRNPVQTNGSAPGPVGPSFSPEYANDKVHRVANLAVQVYFPSGLVAGETARTEAEDLRLRIAHVLTLALGLEYFADRDQAAEVVEIYYQGRAPIAAEKDLPVVDDGEEGPPLDTIRFPSRYRDGAYWYTGVSGETQNEFEVRFPVRLAHLVGEFSRRAGYLRGAPGGEEEPEYQKEGSFNPFNFLVPPAHAVIVGADERVLKGNLNAEQTSSNLQKLVKIGNDCTDRQCGCTGALFGRHHVMTAAHCIVRTKNNEKGIAFGWTPNVHRVGRNGTDWHARADARTGWRWYWVSSLYLAAAKGEGKDKGSSPKEYDIAMVIFPDRHIGEVTGQWFGLWASQTSHDDMRNRGYPSCFQDPNKAPPPGNCQVNHMYGDEHLCSTADFSDAKDPMGFSLVGFHSCDTSGGHSGSPLYRQNSDGIWVIRGVHKGATNKDGWNSFALVTRGRSDMASVFWLMYP